MSELNCHECLYCDCDGDELPCRICTLEKDFFRPDPAKREALKQEEKEEEETEPGEQSAGEGEAHDAGLPIHVRDLHLHIHFHGDACSA